MISRIRNLGRGCAGLQRPSSKAARGKPPRGAGGCVRVVGACGKDVLGTESWATGQPTRIFNVNINPKHTLCVVLCYGICPRRVLFALRTVEVAGLSLLVDAVATLWNESELA